MPSIKELLLTVSDKRLSPQVREQTLRELEDEVNRHLQEGESALHTNLENFDKEWAQFEASIAKWLKSLDGDVKS